VHSWGRYCGWGKRRRNSTPSFVRKLFLLSKVSHSTMAMYYVTLWTVKRTEYVKKRGLRKDIQDYWIYSNGEGFYIGPIEAALSLALSLARACSFKSACSSDSAKVFCAWRYLAKLRAAISSASSICFLYPLIFCCN